MSHSKESVHKKERGEGGGSRCVEKRRKRREGITWFVGDKDTDIKIG